MIDIVLARYSEDIAWSGALHAAGTRVLVYNKGGHLPNSDRLPNVGREGHTYLHHIWTHYDDLADVTVFLQGDIRDHLRQDYNGLHPREMVSLLIEEAIANGASVPRFCIAADPNFRHATYFGKQLHLADRALKPWFETYVQEPFPSDKLLFYKNGLFAVSKSRILSRPREYYKTLLDELAVHEDPEVGHYLERSWVYIFSRVRK